MSLGDRLRASKTRGYELARSLYTDHLRRPLAACLFDRPDPRLVTRRLLDDDPPSYVLDRRTLLPPETARIDSPQGVGPIPDDLREVVREWEFVPPFVSVLGNVDLVGPDALPIAPDGRLIIEAADGSSLRVVDAMVRSVASGVFPVHRGTGDRRDTVVSFAGPWSREFFHWFADYLPRLRVLERYEAETGNAPQLLLPPDPPDWMTRSLSLLGVSRERWVLWAGGRTTVDRLVVPSLPRHSHSTAPPEGYVHSPRELRWLRDRLLDERPRVDPPDVGTRLYVSRSRQSSRRVRNRAEVLSMAREYGFESVHPEQWSLDEQLAVFADADAVLGPHGAGLLNAIYGDDTTLIELFGARTNPCFFAIAEGMGMPYAMTRCEAVKNDLLVDTERLRKLFALALGG
jgi:hypothetical protein